jgi:NAD(P)-dependent dehydrogenase (short-subunit alcohol dehydrogenase family)
MAGPTRPCSPVVGDQHEARRQAAVITGGNSGIGLATAREFNANGAKTAEIVAEPPSIVAYEVVDA